MFAQYKLRNQILYYYYFYSNSCSISFLTLLLPGFFGSYSHLKLQI
jgi:hypothetical protein